MQTSDSTPLLNPSLTASASYVKPFTPVQIDYDLSTTGGSMSGVFVETTSTADLTAASTTLADGIETDLLDKKIRIEDPTEHILQFWDEAKAESDLTVLLSHTGIETSEFLAEDLAFDVVVVGHYPAVSASPKEIGGQTINII